MSAQAHSIDLESVAQAWENLQGSSGLGPIRNEEDYEERVALLNALIDTVRDDEEHPLRCSFDAWRKEDFALAKAPGAIRPDRTRVRAHLRRLIDRPGS